ncbi:hypothetical protein JXA12_03830 [Candidatus Woesearchaeota archaeon]|nr:hypothetical protein [Candidatus Woesearchaeota archaeon]
MAKKTKNATKKKAVKKTTRKHCKRTNTRDNAGGFIYFLGFLGAAIHYLSTTTGFWSGLLGILKSFVWPVFLVHGLLKLIGA